jgi:hypothetical protein
MRGGASPIRRQPKASGIRQTVDLIMIFACSVTSLPVITSLGSHADRGGGGGGKKSKAEGGLDVG